MTSRRQAHRTSVRLLALLLGLVASSLAAMTSAAAQTRRTSLVMISIDGLRPDYVLQADRHGLTIPTLRALLRRGSYATGVRGVTPTVTYPSHTTLVTGVTPARHGITNNATFDPLGKNQDGWYWYSSDIRVPTLWNAAARTGIRTASVNWPVTVGAAITWDIPEYWRAGTDEDRKLLRALATPGLLAELERGLGPYPLSLDGSAAADAARARFAGRLLMTRRPGLLLLHLASLDHEEHSSGPFSPASLATLEALDSVVDTLIQRARQAGGAGTVVAVVSDHGFLPVSRELAVGVALRQAGLLTYASDTAQRPSDWKAAAWTAGGSVAILARDTADTVVKGRVDSIVTALAADTANGIATVLRGDSLRTLGGFPTAGWVLGLRPGFVSRSRTTGPLVAPSQSRGTHGYLPDVPEMRASFFVVGPGVPAGRSLGEIDMRDIAPTLARLLGVRLPDAEGHDVLGARGASAR